MSDRLHNVDNSWFYNIFTASGFHNFQALKVNTFCESRPVVNMLHATGGLTVKVLRSNVTMHW